jgi:hypothetical protein
MPQSSLSEKGLLSTRGAARAASMGSAASAPLKGVAVKRVAYTALGLAARASSSDGVLPSAPCAGQEVAEQKQQQEQQDEE